MPDKLADFSTSTHSPNECAHPLLPPEPILIA